MAKRLPQRHTSGQWHSPEQNTSLFTHKPSASIHHHLIAIHTGDSNTPVLASKTLSIDKHVTLIPFALKAAVLPLPSSVLCKELWDSLEMEGTVYSQMTFCTNCSQKVGVTPWKSKVMLAYVKSEPGHVYRQICTSTTLGSRNIHLSVGFTLTPITIVSEPLPYATNVSSSLTSSEQMGLLLAVMNSFFASQNHRWERAVPSDLSPVFLQCLFVARVSKSFPHPHLVLALALIPSFPCSSPSLLFFLPPHLDRPGFL